MYSTGKIGVNNCRKYTLHFYEVNQIYACWLRKKMNLNILSYALGRRKETVSVVLKDPLSTFHVR